MTASTLCAAGFCRGFGFSEDKFRLINELGEHVSYCPKKGNKD
jgi:hypothetical protein